DGHVTGVQTCALPIFIVRHFEIFGRGSLADARGGVVHRTVARAEITAERAAVLALANAQGHAAEMGADPQGDQPVGLAGLGPLQIGRASCRERESLAW